MKAKDDIMNRLVSALTLVALLAGTAVANAATTNAPAQVLDTPSTQVLTSSTSQPDSKANDIATRCSAYSAAFWSVSVC
jgi:hypothetical protein